MEIDIILLAAGSSSRMGKPKQLLLIDGEALLIKSVKASIHSKASDVAVVLGANYENHQALINNFSVGIIYNSEWDKGMGNSLKKGLNHLLSKNKKPDAVIVLVCDQPFLSSDNIDNLILQFEQTKSAIVASHYSGITGVPALFDGSFFESILQINDEYGAKRLIQQHADKVTTIEFPQGIVDLDFPEDYEMLLRNNNF